MLVQIHYKGLTYRICLT